MKRRRTGGGIDYDETGLSGHGETLVDKAKAFSF